MTYKSSNDWKRTRMKLHEAPLTTGLPGLDRILKGVLPGDNIVWHVDAIEEYQAFVTPFAEAALAAGRKLVYFRFAQHVPLVAPERTTETLPLNPKAGFEQFIAQTHAAIERAGMGAFYVFDCLSPLAFDWYSDQMLGNFFMLTCPYLFNLETVAYFALLRNFHTTYALNPIATTAQICLDAYNHKNITYVRPIKVQHRYSPTMHMLHAWRKQDDSFRTVTSSSVISEILTSAKWSGLTMDSSGGFWESAFIQARERIRSGEYRPYIPERGRALHERLVCMIISRDKNIYPLIARYITLEHILDVRKRMIGTGLIGGKTVGMLLARAILQRTMPKFHQIIEEHDSFFIGSDVFHTFLVQHGIWWVHQMQRDSEHFLDGAEKARRRIITGTFPDYIIQQFDEMLDYFGQSPFIVRSSSLLEDNYGHSFAGKYESVFCANQGPRDRRMQDFLAAVRTIYASSMSEKALTYRARRGMLDKDEQMALLVMRVSGAMYGKSFFPQAAGVGFSFNPYAWDPAIDPKAGVIRLVFGLGTRAVDRSDDDYTRIVALNAPEKRPESNFNEICQYAQRRVDYLDLEANQRVSDYFADLAKTLSADVPLDMFTSVERIQTPDERITEHRVLTFDPLLRDTPFVDDIRQMLTLLQKAYEYPVDIEFTLNFMEDLTYRINLVQCRPLQVQGDEPADLEEVTVPQANRIIEARGAVVGQSRYIHIDRLVYIVPARYGRLPQQDRYEIARLLGEINRASDPDCTMLMMGPGRWGTSSPSLGIPVSFADINRVTALCEIVAMHENLVPDVSLGTHFLNELVEMEMLYLALFPTQGSNYLNEDFLAQAPNSLADILPHAQKWEETIRVIDARHLDGQPALKLLANAQQQKVICFLEPKT